MTPTNLQARPVATPADEETVRQWLLPLSAAVRRMGAPYRDEFEAFARAATIACCDLDASAWSAEALLAALRGFREWPSVGEVRGFLATPLARREDFFRTLLEGTGREETARAEGSDPQA